MVDVKAEEVKNIVNKTVTLNNSKVLPQNGIWRLVIIGAIGLVVVLVLLFLGFILKSLLYVVIFLVIVIVAVAIGVGVSQWKSSKK
jgi:multisubunit Na+/H+ antiporter MnhF subunit